MNKTILDFYDREIIRVLYSSGIPMTISEISKISRMSWITVKTHVDKLLNLKLVEKVEMDKDRERIKFNFEEFGNTLPAVA